MADGVKAFFLSLLFGLFLTSAAVTTFAGLYLATGKELGDTRLTGFMILAYCAYSVFVALSYVGVMKHIHTLEGWMCFMTKPDQRALTVGLLRRLLWQAKDDFRVKVILVNDKGSVHCLVRGVNPELDHGRVILTLSNDVEILSRHIIKNPASAD